MNKLRSLFVYILLIVASSLYSDAFHTIRWKGISSALGYSVEIKDESGKISTQSTKSPSITIKMARGKYSYRIAVLNKLNVVEKWSDWKELEVKAVAPPVVDAETSMVQADAKLERITFSGENLYEGTKAFVVQNGKRIPAKIETSRDGKTSIVTVDKKLVDPKKDHSVVLENPKFDPIQVSISGELIDHPPEHSADKTDNKSLDSSNNSSTEFHPETNTKFWPMFWRQAVLPGWGHHYVNHDKTAYSYYAILGATVVNTGVQYTEYQTKSASYRTAEDFSEGLRAATDPLGLIIPFYTNGLESRVDEQRNRLNNSVGAVGIVYGTALIHIIYTGTKNSMGSRKHSFFEMLWRQMVLPGWGHYLIGDKSTAFGYFGLVGATALNAAYQNHVYREKLADYRTMEDNSESARALNPNDLFVPALINTKESRVAEQANRLNNSVGAIGAVYLTSIIHIMLTAHLRKYNDSGASNFGFGIRPEDPVGMTRSIDPNLIRADLRYSIYF
jgi:hypothetical protein